jgi:hypothetical protein
MKSNYSLRCNRIHCCDCEPKVVPHADDLLDLIGEAALTMASNSAVCLQDECPHDDCAAHHAMAERLRETYFKATGFQPGRKDD